MDDIVVSVEALAEAKIKEICFDGSEIPNIPLSLSEQLSQAASKIDFSEIVVTKTRSKRSSTTEQPGPDKQKKSASHTQTSTQSDQWKSVKQNLKLALIEIGVLLDLIQLSRQRHYMVIDHVQQEPLDVKLGAQHHAKKKGLTSAGHLLMSAADQLKQSIERRCESWNTGSDFHSQLIKLHHAWRLKTHANHIIGDLSYKSAGSNFPHHGVFEVVKNEEWQSSASSTDVEMSAVPATLGSSSLKVIIPSELQGTSSIQVHIQKEGNVLLSTDHVTLSQYSPPLGARASSDHWQHTLEEAQNVLFCKELFARLRKEARNVELKMPPLVLDKSIYCTLFPGVQLVISLHHRTSATDSSTDTSTNTDTKQQVGPVPTPTRYYVLENSLQQMLCDVHRWSLAGSGVTGGASGESHPVTGHTRSHPLHYTAGPLAVHKDTLMDVITHKALLEQLVDHAKHIVLRARTFTYLDALAKEFKEPSVQIHWNAVNSRICSIVRVQCVFPFYDSICRTTLELKIGCEGIEIRCKDGRTMNVSYEFNELKNVMLSQIAQHHVMVALAVCRPMSWVVLSNSMSLGCGPLEYVGNASSCVLLSPQRNRHIIIRSGVTSGLKVIIKGVTEADARRLLPPEISWRLCERGTGAGEDKNSPAALSIDWTRLLMYNSFPQKLEYLMSLLGQE